jgi:hypothetical protein
MGAKVGRLLNRSAYFDECKPTGSASARPLGVIALQMMENDVPPYPDGKIVLKQPGKWSAKASNFLHVASEGTLKDIEKVGAPTLVQLMSDMHSRIDFYCRMYRQP